MSQRKLRKILPSMNLRAFRFTASLVLLVSVLIGGCAAPTQPAASSNLQLTSEEKATKRILDDRDREQIVRILASVAADHESVDPPRAALLGVRWKDIPIAMAYACQENEMAITRTIESVDQIVFELKTIDDHPGRFELHRVDDDSIYQITLVEVGRFSTPENQAIASKLKEEFERQLRLFGQKRAFTTDGD